MINTTNGSPVVNGSNQVFAQNALAMRREGFAVLPSKGKSPMMAGFNAWKSAPGEQTVSKWASKTPDADLVYVPGLSKASRAQNGIIVLDGDDEEACGRILETFGDTPGRVKTRRGQHFLYRDTGTSLGRLSSLKAHGLNADVKHGKSIVVAPPSHHEKDRGFVYSWDGCNASVINELPTFNVKALQDLIDSRVAARRSEPLRNTSTLPPAVTRQEGFRDGSRAQALNDFLVSQAWAFDEADLMTSALDVARTWNDNLPKAGYESLDDSEVMVRVRQVVKDLEAGKLERRQSMRATCTSDADEVRYLCGIEGGDSAFALLQLLRAEHAARCKAGQTFIINVEGMVASRVMGSWAARKYRAARDVLIAEGLIIMVKPAVWKRAAEYVLADRILTPSIAVRMAAA